MGNKLHAELPMIRFCSFPMHIMSMAETVSIIIDRIKNNTYTQHVVVNVAKLVNMSKDAKLRESVTSCDIINIDGMGVVWGARLCGHKVPERVSGIDLFFELNKEAEKRGIPVYYLGARSDIVKTVSEVMQKRFPSLKIAGNHHGYFWDDEERVISLIRESKARMLFVAISSPKKENFINKWKDQIGVPFVMGVGGTFDVVAGKVNRAPLFIQKTGMEWLYRVYQEPKRMWKRYLLTNMAFLIMLMREFTKTVLCKAPGDKNSPRRARRKTGQSG